MNKNILLTCITTVALLPFSLYAQDSVGEVHALHSAAPVVTDVPAGLYTLDKAHTSLLFRVNHLGLSHYTARFTGVDGELTLDPQHPEKSQISATIDPSTLQTDFPDTKRIDFDVELQNEKWLNTKQFPKINFHSTKIELTGNDTAKITGDLTLHGVMKPIVLEAKFNGGIAKMPMGPADSRIGFSAHGSLKRSAFGVAAGIPQPGSAMGVGDDVEIIIETEFTRPAPAAASPAK